MWWIQRSGFRCYRGRVLTVNFLSSQDHHLALSVGPFFHGRSAEGSAKIPSYLSKPILPVRAFFVLPFFCPRPIKGLFFVERLTTFLHSLTNNIKLDSSLLQLASFKHFIFFGYYGDTRRLHTKVHTKVQATT